MKYISFSLNETKKIAKSILKLANKRPILLDGELGSGKTTLVQFIGKELKHTGIINSPTFNIMNVYKNLIHIDAYRISGSLQEFYDFFEDKQIVIEWAKNIDSSIFKNYIHVSCFLNLDNSHTYEVDANV